MENIKEIIKKSNKSLNELLEKLKLLELEKDKLINSYKICDAKQKVLLEEKMKESEESFKSLYNEIILLSDIVKKLKKHYC